jgi:hypothetical protein
MPEGLKREVKETSKDIKGDFQTVVYGKCSQEGGNS